MRLLTLLLVLFTSQFLAQFNTIDGKTFRRLTDFSMPTRNFGVDTVKAISIIDTSRASGLLLLSKDSTAMYPYADTMNMFTTAKAWKFTPKITFKGNPNQVLYYGADSFLTTDNGFIFADTAFLLTVQNNTLSTNTNIIRSQNDVLTLGAPLGGFLPHNTINIDTNGISFNYTQNNVSYRFPTDTGQVGQQLFIQSIDTTGTNILAWGNQILSDTATLDFASIPAQLFEDLTVTVTGASVGDVVSIGIPTAAAVPSSMFTAFVSATDTVTIRAANISLISIDPASGLFKVKVFKD